MINLGKLKEIKDLRKVWPHEALDFTPWLAEEDSILGGTSNMIKILFVCHGNILRSLEKACYFNGFPRSDGAYYTTITPFTKEL